MILMERAGSRNAHVRGLLGVYVLGGLSRDEELHVRSHLAGCPRCRAEYDDLACIPLMLDLLVEDDANGPETG